MLRLTKTFVLSRLLLLLTALALALGPARASLAQGSTYPVTATDQTPAAPLANPAPAPAEPRYLSGFGSDDNFTIFYEDRNDGGRIYFNATTSGPTGFAAASTATNIPSETHFLVKDWPITIGGTAYAYRAWGAVGNNDQHRFYVSNDLINWTLVSTFTIPNAPTFANANGFVYYGFHDVILLNGTYYAFAESNGGQTMIVRSANGDDVWEAFASVGGLNPADGPLHMPGPTGPTPTGSFVELGNDRGYGKIHIPGDDSALYLAINTAARPNLAPAALEAAFMDPANWTWNDGTTGLPSSPLLSATAEHNWKEAWLAPRSDPNADWVIVYTADYGAADGDNALGWIGAEQPSSSRGHKKKTSDPPSQPLPTPTPALPLVTTPPPLLLPALGAEPVSTSRSDLLPCVLIFGGAATLLAQRVLGRSRRDAP